MIESIQIKEVATYGGTPEVAYDLTKLNFFYGSNGSGKTTISRVIANIEEFPSCKVTWKGGTKLQTMVYNRDFVEKNFNQSTELKGIFTLGEQNVETLNKIISAKAEFDTLTNSIENLNRTLHGIDGTSGKKGELAAAEEELKNKCWGQKQKHDAKLFGALEGYRNNAEKFKQKILQERASNSATLETLEYLEKKAETVFGSTPTTIQAIQAIDTAEVISHESNSILKKRVIGKDDVDIAAMIKKLGNSDWVREGRTFYEANEAVCPFCQQSTTDAFAQSLNEYFDETFLADSKAIDDLSINYATDSARIQQQLVAIIANASNKFIDVEKLKIEKKLLDSKIMINTQRLALKKKESSQVVELESISNVVSSIKVLIDDANTQTDEHNKMVANLSKERKNLTAQVWKFLLEELKADLQQYDSSQSALTKAIKAITDNITPTTEAKIRKSSEIRELEKETTSVQPTIDGINSLLHSFGFRGFSLAKAQNDTSYKLVRPDGKDAQETLSEGEKSFVTFLYFFHFLKGSDSETGITTNRIVVFDDPVSSLDSDILFIVGSLIKGLFEEVRAGTGHVKQVFVLTHNVYFHKEVSFNPNRRNNQAMRSEETFWIVRKTDSLSTLEKHDTNPIKTSYELLWSEVRRSDRSNSTIQNSLRRILESYFKILGGVDPDEICAKFDGKEKLVCKSLFSWVNDGSHFASDDLFMAVESSMVETYLKVFRAIFEKTEQTAHYKMMMGEAYVETSALEQVA
jgi:wobble nucleotide-excising tRNase